MRLFKVKHKNKALLRFAAVRMSTIKQEYIKKVDCDQNTALCVQIVVKDAWPLHAHMIGDERVGTNALIQGRLHREYTEKILSYDDYIMLLIKSIMSILNTETDIAASFNNKF